MMHSMTTLLRSIQPEDQAATAFVGCLAHGHASRRIRILRYPVVQPPINCSPKRPAALCPVRDRVWSDGQSKAAEQQTKAVTTRSNQLSYHPGNRMTWTRTKGLVSLREVTDIYGIHANPVPKIRSRWVSSFQKK